MKKSELNFNFSDHSDPYTIADFPSKRGKTVDVFSRGDRLFCHLSKA